METSDVRWLLSYVIVIALLLFVVSRSGRLDNISEKPIENDVLTEQTNISVYDSLFMKYAKTIDWDWRLLAAISYRESGFNCDATTEDGSGGLMGIMTFTAKIFNLPLDSIIDPEANIRTAVLLLGRLDRRYSDIESVEERQKFIIAGYNAGIGHIADARALALKYGKNPDVWKDVEEYMLLKNEPEYYTDSVCVSGQFKGEQTRAYLADVLQLFEKYKSKVR